MINIFELPAEQVKEFIAQRGVRAKIMAAAPGFQDSRLHRAVSPEARFQLVNIAHWDSQAHLDAALGSGAFQDRIRALREARRCCSSPTRPCTRSPPYWASHEASLASRHPAQLALGSESGPLRPTGAR